MPTYSNLQVLFIDERNGQVVARGRTIPFCWDGTLDDLPTGIDAAGIRAITESDPPSALSALAAEVDRDYRGSGLSTLLIKSMRTVAQLHGFTPLLAPVRPTWKDRYPLTPIERYAEWRRDDGLLFDPWLRTHERLGGTILRCEPRSLEITAPVADWERWVGMQFPEEGRYAFPGGLAPLDVSDGTGRYFEPNVWVLHGSDSPMIPWWDRRRDHHLEGATVGCTEYSSELPRHAVRVAPNEELRIRDQSVGAGEICRRILKTLPTWFAIPSSVEDYVVTAQRSPTVIASFGDEDVGILTLVRHSPHAAEVYVMAVRPELHRQGIGRALLGYAEGMLAADSMEFLQVKTLAPSKPDAGYDRTRAFYLANGFRPLEELPDLWDPENPALQMVKVIPKVDVT